MVDERQWLAEAIQFYRGLGFLALYEGMAVDELVEKLIADRKADGTWSFAESLADVKVNDLEEIHVEFGVSQPLVGTDMVLLSEDKDRVYWDDGETDIWPEGRIYEGVFAEWSRISRGAFVISKIEELWEDEKLVGVEFEWNEERFRALPDPESTGWIDFDVLDQVNKAIEPSGLKYEIQETGDQTTFIVVVTAEEKEILTKRGWRFFSDDDD